jgi:Cu(I)/Ag(I) efflux system membrane protein CusA/SilA
MIERVIEFSAKNKYFVLIVVIAAMAGATWCVKNLRLDAIPDLSDTQVIIFTRWDRSPDIIEDQVTYPIVTALLGAPKVKAIRGFSDFGFSYVYVIFEDGTDIYWARSRVIEYLSKIVPRLPEGVQTEMGPDATSVGWVYQYALVDKSSGLVSALSPAIGTGGRRSGGGRRIREAIPGQHRPEPAAGLQHSPDPGH